MKQKIGIIVLAIMTLNFTGCAIFQSPPVKYLPNDNSMIQLNHIAERAQQSTAVLAEIQAQNKDKKNKKNQYRTYSTYSHRRHRESYQTNDISYNINKSNQKISLSFEGPVNEVVQKLSAKAGYQFMMSGNQLKNLKSFPTVSVIETNTPLSNIVMHINQQLPSNIRVVCYPKTKSLLLIIQATGA